VQYAQLHTATFSRGKVARLGLYIAYVCTKFVDCRFSRSRDMVGAQQNLNVLRDLTTFLSEIICHLWDSTCYDQPAYEI